MCTSRTTSTTCTAATENAEIPTLTRVLLEYEAHTFFVPQWAERCDSALSETKVTNCIICYSLPAVLSGHGAGRFSCFSSDACRNTRTLTIDVLLHD
jgi:alpha-D-ribose 1-methylphosphonate 5-phosphate C-P lyase